MKKMENANNKKEKGNLFLKHLSPNHNPKAQRDADTVRFMKN